MSDTIRATRPEPPPHVSARVEIAHTPIPKWAIGEFFGTFSRFFGCGSVCAAAATGAQIGIFQVAIVWGLGIATAILSHWLAQQRAPESRGHDRGRGLVAFSPPLGPFLSTRAMIAAFAVVALLYALFAGALAGYETAHGIVRGAPGSEATAMVFADFFQIPAGKR